MEQKPNHDDSEKNHSEVLVTGIKLYFSPLSDSENSEDEGDSPNIAGFAQDWGPRSTGEQEVLYKSTQKHNANGTFGFPKIFNVSIQGERGSETQRKSSSLAVRSSFYGIKWWYDMNKSNLQCRGVESMPDHWVRFCYSSAALYEEISSNYHTHILLTSRIKTRSMRKIWEPPLIGEFIVKTRIVVKLSDKQNLYDSNGKGNFYALSITGDLNEVLKHKRTLTGQPVSGGSAVTAGMDFRGAVLHPCECQLSNTHALLND